ncbi:type II toxin-antitoxin system RelE/ParE family toxin [Pasteurellaceae bacterium USgator11]|uniref:Type II toxin-antitoxin system RelE/ParE family toxin n=1 Tax=Testudinibacter aquarius TaxID=1524974 RepID=A0ABY2XVH7_9PAST|nr:type II toxin-antitoxin system RelE/ParE family toxin [Testudinibacter aquarius]TNG96301.1 type II toxin-antitoxin system RelE/ParE family toxin [Pasteurellaceae bacterium USgator41]TNG97193.1 type II toxin-antitoxin system RelE/ParE family toxin [Pasteurellaceae bacterium UScroc12]TNH00403.1 type II toxin-antitoxin system RelE/ParE family toxin [Pasteurellaceae bacterium UScroc31]TNH03094.1 type II toxin-antitoxin system RelE/ParE family toxin [Pasteurellaceae bacterium USgator11]
MVVKLFWEAQAQQDREQIFHYFFEHAGLALADQVDAKFEEMAVLLKQNPQLGKKVKEASSRYRKLIIPHFPFILIYVLEKESLIILRVLHSARKLASSY